MGRRYTVEQLEWIKEKINDFPNYVEMVKSFNEKFKDNRTDQGIMSIATKKLKLNKSFNSGRYSETLKKDETPLGTIRCGNNGVTYIKVKLVGANRPKFSGYKKPYWLPLQMKIYQDKYGAMQDNEMVIFLDCNRNNYDIDNLYCIDRRVSAILAKNKWYSNNPEITKTGILYAKLILSLNKNLKED